MQATESMNVLREATPLFWTGLNVPAEVSEPE